MATKRKREWVEKIVPYQRGEQEGFGMVLVPKRVNKRKKVVKKKIPG